MQSSCNSILTCVTVISPTFGEKRMQDVLINDNGDIDAIEEHDANRKIDINSQVINLEGKFIIPGLIDTHFHLMATGLSELSVNLLHATEIPDIQELLAAAKESTDEESWILATGLNEEKLKEKRPVTRAELDACCGSRPVFIDHRSLHYAVVNTEAIKRLGLLDEGTSGGSGEELREGIIKDNLLNKSRQALMRGLSKSFLQKSLRYGSALAAKKGLTTVHAIEGGELFGDEYLSILLDIRDELDTWVNLYWITTDIDAAHQKGLQSVGGDILLDGTLGSRTAALWKDYADEEGCSGVLYRTQAEVDEFFFRARQAGIQPAVHAIGGRAIEQALNAIGVAEKRLPGIDNRPRIEHFGEANKAQINRASELRMGVASQPPFAYLRGGPDGVYCERMGTERASQLYAFRLMLDQGVQLAGGSDSPVVSLDPILGMHSCINAHYEAQRLSVQEALQIYTITGAWLGFEERTKGDLQVGMNADLVVLDRNPLSIEPTSFQDCEVLLTMKGGRIMFNALG